MKVHVVSETEFVATGKEVHNAFIDHVEILKEQDDVDVVVNGRGVGDLLHSHTFGPYFLWKGRKYKGKRIYTVHDVPESVISAIPLAKYCSPFIRWYFKKVYSYADVCIANSPQIEKTIKDIGAKTRIININNPINLEKWKFSDERRRIGREMLELSPHEFAVIGVGRIDPDKGIDDFIAVAENLPGVKFVWIGGRPFTSLTDRIKIMDNRISRAPKNVKFTGPQRPENMSFLYAASDVLLFPSYKENCPLAPLEAAACSRPVVFRDLEEYQKLYQSRYIKVADNKGFTEIIQNLLYDSEFYARAQHLSEQLIIQFDKDQVRRKLLALYTEMLDNDSTYKKPHNLQYNPTGKDEQERMITAAYWNMIKE
jgi:1,2-diacylglycerol-3-alpha-glucose alpha-1,2-galactosyltransferase